jgi:hypothetical protein
MDVADQAQSALSNSPIHALRELHVQRDGDRLILSGCVDSFYHKQLAQEVVRIIARDMQVVNAVDVQYNGDPET